MDHLVGWSVLRRHAHDADYLPHRYRTLQVSGTTYRLPVRLLLLDECRLLGAHLPRPRRGRLRRQNDRVQRQRAQTVHSSLPAGIFLWHGVVAVVGDPHVHLVPGRRLQVEQRGHRQLLAILSSSRLAGTHGEVSRSADLLGRRWRSCRWDLLGGQPESDESATFRPHTTHHLPHHRYVVLVWRLRVAVPHPQHVQEPGRARRPPQSRQTGEADDQNWYLQRAVYVTSDGADCVLLLRVDAVPRVDVLADLPLRRQLPAAAQPPEAHLPGAHAQVFHGLGRGHHIRRVDLVGQNGRIVAQAVEAAVRWRRQRQEPQVSAAEQRRQQTARCQAAVPVTALDTSSSGTCRTQ